MIITEIGGALLLKGDDAVLLKSEPDIRIQRGFLRSVEGTLLTKADQASLNGILSEGLTVSEENGPG